MPPDLTGLFGGPGVSPKYREHGVGLGFPIEGYSDRPAGSRPPVTMGPGQKLSGYMNVKVRVFDLSKPDDLLAYTEVRDKIANRLCVAIDRKVMANDDTGQVRVFVEWGEVIYKRPTQSELPGTTGVRPH